MKIITTTSMRKNISEIINRVMYSGQVFGIWRKNNIEALIIKYPKNINAKFNDITNINATSQSFDFLKDERDIYIIEDLKKRYV